MKLSFSIVRWLAVSGVLASLAAGQKWGGQTILRQGARGVATACNSVVTDASSHLLPSDGDRPGPPGTRQVTLDWPPAVPTPSGGWNPGVLPLSTAPVNHRTNPGYVGEPPSGESDLSSSGPLARGEDSIDGGVVQVKLPNEDVTLYYLESRTGMTLELRSDSASVTGRKIYVGDGTVAVKLEAQSTNGILFQGETRLHQGFVFKKRSIVRVLPGYRLAAELKPGDVYVSMPGVTFLVPDK